MNSTLPLFEDSAYRRMGSIVVAIGLLVTAPGSVCGQDQESPETNKVPVVSHLEARLFQNKSGTWSEDVLDPKHRELWNTSTGPAASNATLVIVEVSGAAGGTYTGFFGPKTKYEVHIVATEGGHTSKLLEQTQTIPIMNDQGKAFIPFLLKQSGCSSVRIRVGVVGFNANKTVERTLDFACGE